MAFVVVYDACVLHANTLRDLLIRIAKAGMVQAKWTDDILDEVDRSLTRRTPPIAADKLRKRRQLMNAAIRDCLVCGYQPLIEGLKLPDPDDRHVLAAAIKAGAQVIVTLNLRDFPARDPIPTTAVAWQVTRMRHAYTVETIRTAERALMERLPAGTLMGRAAAGLAASCVDAVGGGYGRPVVALVGSGGDALYACARLARRGAAVTAILLSPDRAHPGRPRRPPARWGTDRRGGQPPPPHGDGRGRRPRRRPVHPHLAPLPQPRRGHRLRGSDRRVLSTRPRQLHGCA